MAIVLSIDPARKSGWALWRDGRLLRFGTVDLAPKDCENPESVVIARWWDLEVKQRDTMHAHPYRMVIETWGRHRKVHPALIGRFWRWVTWAELNRWDWQAVDSNTWQAALGCTGKSAQRKAWALQLAWAQIERDEAGFPPDCTEDAADAICVGLHFLKSQQIAGVVE